VSGGFAEFKHIFSEYFLKYSILFFFMLGSKMSSFQVAQAYDDSVTQEVTNHLFQEPGKKWGMDLAAINMQRGREQGIPGYGR